MSGQSIPPAHIAFNRQKIFEANSPRCTRGSLKHEAAELGVEHRRSLVSSVSQSVQAAQDSSKRSYFDSPTARSGTPPPCLRSSASLASAARMSACLSESFTSLFSSSKFTTRYSIWPTCQHYPTDIPAILPYLVSPQQGIALLAFCVAPDSQKLLLSASEPAHIPCVPRVLYTSMPHLRTWLAFSLASGQSSGVPMAL